MAGASRLDLLDQSISVVERYTRCLLKDTQLKNKAETFADLSTYVAYYCKAMQIHEKTDEVFNRYVQNVEESDLDRKEIVKDFKKKVQESLQNLKDVEEIKRYEEYLELISDDANASEVMTISQSVNTIDPISKLPIVNPVKNKKCGHSYEETTILELISKNKNLRCPMVGCNVQGIKKGDLMPDHKLKQYLQNQKHLEHPVKKCDVVLDESSQELSQDEE